MKSVRPTMRLWIQALVFVMLVVGCRYDKVDELSPTTDDELSIADAQRMYEAEYANARVSGPKKTIMWGQAEKSTFSNGIPLISIPIKVDGPPRTTIIKDEKGKPEKITLPSPVLISYKDSKTKEYVYKEVQAIPKKGTVTKNGRGHLQNFKGIIYVSNLSGKVERMFDVTNGKYKVGRPASAKNARTSNQSINICTFQTLCASTINASYDYHLTCYVYTYASSGVTYPDITPEEALGYGWFCNEWEFVSCDPYYIAEPDPVLDPVPSTPIQEPVAGPGPTPVEEPEEPIEEDPDMLGADCPGDDQLARLLNIPKKDIHRVKKDILAACSPGCTNPDICIIKGKIWLKCTEDKKKQCNTGTTLEDWKE